jgi:hypothetical protein
MTIRPRVDTTTVVIDGRKVGRMNWSNDERNEIHIFGDIDAVGPVAREVASQLGGEYDPTALTSDSEYGRFIERAWGAISLHDGPDVFLEQLRRFRPEVGLVFAAHWCQSEVANGGLHQFFWNGTGVLAPEAVAGFGAMGLDDWAGILAEAMQFFGDPYPRDCAERKRILDQVDQESRRTGLPFRSLDERFDGPMAGAVCEQRNPASLGHDESLVCALRAFVTQHQNG